MQVDTFVEVAIAAFADVNKDEWLCWGAQIMPLQAEMLAEFVAARKAREEEEREAEHMHKEDAQKAEEAARLEEATQNVTERFVEVLVTGDEIDGAITAEVQWLERKARGSSKGGLYTRPRIPGRTTGNHRESPGIPLESTWTPSPGQTLPISQIPCQFLDF